MRLLLDEHYDPEIARQLRELGHDVIAVAERDDLRGRPDPEIFGAAAADGRAIVTENVRDFAPLVRRTTELDERHSGVIFTVPSRHPHPPGARSELVAALARLLEEHAAPDALQDVVFWL